jgi:CBS domain-containing protein
MNSLPDPLLDGAPLYDAGALEVDVRDVMTSGVVTIPENSTLDEAVDAMAAHRIHAVLVVGSQTGTMLGWVTTRGLLGMVDWDAKTPATEAISEQAMTIEPNASVRSAIYALALPGVTRLLVRHRPLDPAEGVVTDYDLTVRATRLSRRRA